MLVRAGANINWKDFFDKPFFFLAVQTGDTELVKLFVQKGADVNMRWKYEFDDTYAIFVALDHNDRKMLSTLVSLGARTNVKEDEDTIFDKKFFEGEKENTDFEKFVQSLPHR